MTDYQRPRDFAMSRRLLLGYAVTATGLAAAGGLASGNAYAQAKLSQKQAKYQNEPKDEQTCAGCSNFIAPTSCKLVAGQVSAAGWCMLYDEKAKS